MKENSGRAALLALVNQKWIEAAFNYFRTGKTKLYFKTDSPIKKAINEDIAKVYFKLTARPAGKVEISHMANLIEVTDKNPHRYRLPGCESETGKYYYGFNNLKKLNIPLKLEEMERYSTGKRLLRTLPGACLIANPKPDKDCKDKRVFRGLDDEFISDLIKGRLRYILEFERKNRKSFMVEIRDNFLDLYFLGHTVEVRRKGKGYCLIASNEFSPRGSLATTNSMVKAYGPRKWQISIDDINDSKCFNDIMVQVIAKIVAHKRGNISEGVSEINHFIDNRAIGKNGILVIDRQVVYPGKKDCRIDLLGLKRIKDNIFTFAVIELKNKNNKEIESVFSGQTKRYIDIVYDKYDDFMSTYKNVLEQKVKLGLLKAVDCRFARKEEISKKDIMGAVVLDNYNIRSDLKQDGLLGRAIDDWAKMSDDYTMRLFLKTNILDDTFFINRTEAGHLLSKFKKCNS